MNLSQVFPSGLSTHDVTLLGYGLHLNLRDDHLQSYILACAIRAIDLGRQVLYTYWFAFFEQIVVVNV
jgi:hypothetical protein